jgi:hypothetical protein
LQLTCPTAVFLQRGGQAFFCAGCSGSYKKNCLQLTCPTAVFYSEEDKLSSVLDVLDLIDQLPNVVFTVRSILLAFSLCNLTFASL